MKTTYGLTKEVPHSGLCLRGELPVIEPHDRPSICVGETLNPEGQNRGTQMGHNIRSTSSLKKFRGNSTHNEFYNEFLLRTQQRKVSK